MKKLFFIIGIALVGCQSPDPIAVQYEEELKEVFPDYKFTKMEFIGATTQYDKQEDIAKMNLEYIEKEDARIERYKRKIKYTRYQVAKEPLYDGLYKTIESRDSMIDEYNVLLDKMKTDEQQLKSDTISKQFIHHFTNNETPMGIVVTVNKNDSVVKKGNPMELTSLLALKEMFNN